MKDREISSPYTSYTCGIWRELWRNGQKRDFLFALSHI